MVFLPVVEIRDVKVKLPSLLSSKRIGRQKVQKSLTETPSHELLLLSSSEGSDALDASNAEVDDAPTLVTPAIDGRDDRSANDGRDDSSDDACEKKNDGNVEGPCASLAVYKDSRDIPSDGSGGSGDMTVVTGNTSTRCCVDDWIGTKPTVDEVEEEIKLKTIDEKQKDTENAEKDGDNNDVVDLKDPKNVTEDTRNAEDDVDTTEDIIILTHTFHRATINDTNVKKNPKGKLLSIHPIKRISTWNKKVKTAVLELETGEKEKEEVTENATDNTKNAEEDVDTTKGVTETTIVAETNPKNKPLSLQPSKRIGTLKKKMKTAALELKSNHVKKKKDTENVTEDMKNAKDTITNENVKENIQTAEKNFDTCTAKNITEDDIVAIVKKVLSKDVVDVSPSELNRHRSDTTSSTCSEDSFLDTGMDAKYLHDLSTFLHEHQQVAHTMQNTLRLVYSLNDMADNIAGRYDPSVAIDRVDDATYNSSPYTTLLGWLDKFECCVDKQFDESDNAITQTKTVKFRNDLPKKYNEEEYYGEEREGEGMETIRSDRIGDTRDLAEM